MFRTQQYLALAGAGPMGREMSPSKLPRGLQLTVSDWTARYTSFQFARVRANPAADRL